MSLSHNSRRMQLILTNNEANEIEREARRMGLSISKYLGLKLRRII